MQFWVHFAVEIFQRELEKRLDGIPRTVLRIDDILVTGENDQLEQRQSGSESNDVKWVEIKGPEVHLPGS